MNYSPYIATLLCLKSGAIFVVIAAVTIILLLTKLWNHSILLQETKAILKQTPSSILLGNDAASGSKIYLQSDLRTAHTQVIGTTNAGKTASTILPWAVQDMQQGRGLIIIDGKADKLFLETLYAHALACNRESDFAVFSLANSAVSKTFNPFAVGTPQQITERVFSAFEITDPYYSSVQFSVLKSIIELLCCRGEVATPAMVLELLKDQSLLAQVCENLPDSSLKRSIDTLTAFKPDDFEKRISGLLAALDQFSSGDTAKLFNITNPEINLREVIQRKKICYFQLPTMQSKILGSATGKLLLQCLQSTISDIQVRGNAPESLFSVYLDDFNDYMYPAFASLLNKSRSANIGVVFSHQSLGDLEKVSPDFKQIVLTNTNIKVIMKSNDPDTAEHFAASIGTRSTEQSTKRRRKTLFWYSNTGDESVRATEEYLYHPNIFKSQLSRGEGVIVIPHPLGTETKRVRFSMAPHVPQIPLPVRHLVETDYRQYLMAKYHNQNPLTRVTSVNKKIVGGSK